MSVSPATDIFAVARYFPCSSQRFPAGPRASGLRDGGVQGALVRFQALVARLHACTNGVLAQQSPPGARAVAIRERIEGLKEMAQAAASTGGSVDCGEKPP